jgi:hypothetical protein
LGIRQVKPLIPNKVLRCGKFPRNCHNPEQIGLATAAMLLSTSGNWRYGAGSIFQ